MSKTKMNYLLYRKLRRKDAKEGKSRANGTRNRRRKGIGHKNKAKEDQTDNKKLLTMTKQRIKRRNERKKQDTKTRKTTTAKE